MPTVVEVQEEEEAIPELVRLLGTKRFVRVDGHSGHGKTRVAKALSERLGWSHVAVDDYLDGRPRSGRRYADMVDRRRLIAAIEECPEGVVLDGICLNEIVPPETYGPEFSVYVRSYFAPEFDGDEQRRRSKLGTDRYHRQYDPVRWTDVIVVKLSLA